MTALTPSPPFHSIPGVPNFRDLGGYLISNSDGSTKIVRPGVVFRSSEPSKLTPEGETQLRDLGIKTVYDLRSLIELEGNDGPGGRGRYKVREWEGAERVFVPVFMKEDYSPEAVAKRYVNFAGEGARGFVDVYSRILVAGSSPDNEFRPYARMLEHLANENEPTPLLMHCSAGKDRTGVICALILSLCGVADEVVAHEYSLTDLGLATRHEEFVSHLLREPGLKDNEAGARRMVGSRKENMLATLQKIRDTYGSVESCVTQLKLLSPEGIEKLRRNLVVDSSGSMVEAVDWEAHSQTVKAYVKKQESG